MRKPGERRAGDAASPARTDGPIYDLPEGIGQEIVCDERNREYLLLTTEQGGVFLMPYLDEDGEQGIMPQARTQRSRPVWSSFFYSTSNTNARLTTNTCICSPTEQLVEARRIELRSILNCPQGATGLVSDRASERIGSQTNVAAPSRFSLSRGHTDYVPQGIPLK